MFELFCFRKLKQVILDLASHRFAVNLGLYDGYSLVSKLNVLNCSAFFQFDGFFSRFDEEFSVIRFDSAIAFFLIR